MKARYFNGVLAENMFENLKPLMVKKPSTLILHMGNNITYQNQ